MGHRYDVQYRFLAWSLSHVIDALSWHQHAVLRRHRLDPIHLAFLVRAGRRGRVSFDEIRRDTGLGIHPIRRAAKRLKERGLGTVKPIGSDRRRRRFRISKKGRDLLEAIESTTAMAVLQSLGGVVDDWSDSTEPDYHLNQFSERYFEFTRQLWNLTRFLPERGCGNDEYFFPTDIAADAELVDLFKDYFRPLVEPLWAKRQVAAPENDAEPD